MAILDEHTLSRSVMKDLIYYDDSGILILSDWLDRIPKRFRDPVKQVLMTNDEQLESMKGMPADYSNLQYIIGTIHLWMSEGLT